MWTLHGCGPPEAKEVLPRPVTILAMRAVPRLPLLPKSNTTSGLKRSSPSLQRRGRSLQGRGTRRSTWLNLVISFGESFIRQYLYGRDFKEKFGET
jgi:hypothetical protein